MSRSNKIVAKGDLDRATFIGSRFDGTCTITFLITDVPGGHGFYQVEVSHRGKVTVTEDDARAGRVSLTLG